jgi:hypothetical protein
VLDETIQTKSKEYLKGVDDSLAIICTYEQAWSKLPDLTIVSSSADILISKVTALKNPTETKE